MQKPSGISDIRQMCTGDALHIPPWGWGSLKEELTLSRVLEGKSMWVKQGRVEGRECIQDGRDSGEAVIGSEMFPVAGHRL